MIDFVKNLWNNPINPYLVVFGYWLPVVTSLVYWSFEITKKYINEQKAYTDAVKNGHLFISELTIGHIVGMVIVSFIPMVNAFVMLFRFLPTIIGKIYSVCDRIFNIKLTPNHNPATNIRKMSEM